MYTIFYGIGLTATNGGFYGHKWIVEELTSIANGDYGEKMTEKEIQAMCNDINAHGGHNGFKVWAVVNTK
jgi:hypothetical protein